MINPPPVYRPCPPREAIQARKNPFSSAPPVYQPCPAHEVLQLKRTVRLKTQAQIRQARSPNSLAIQATGNRLPVNTQAGRHRLRTDGTQWHETIKSFRFLSHPRFVVPRLTATGGAPPSYSQISHTFMSGEGRVQASPTVLLKSSRSPQLIQRFAFPLNKIPRLFRAVALQFQIAGAPRGIAGRGVVQRIQIEGERISGLHNRMMEAEPYQKLVKAADEQGEVTMREGKLPYGMAGTDWGQRLIVINPDEEHSDADIANCIIFELLNAQDTNFLSIFETANSSEDFALRAVEQEWTHAKKFQEVAHAVSYVTGINPGLFPSQSKSHQLPKKQEYMEHSKKVGHLEAMQKTFDKYRRTKTVTN